MFCWKCGQEVKDGSRFCTHCGAELRRGNAADTTAPRAEAPTTAAPQAAAPRTETSGAAAPTASAPTAAAGGTPAKQKKKFSWIGIVVAVAVILAARAIGGAVGRSMAARTNGSSDTGTSLRDTVQDAAPTPKPVDERSEAIVPPLTDLLTLHEVYYLDEGGGIGDYVIVYYGSDTHFMTDLTVEYVFSKAEGYTLDIVQSADFPSMFPSFGECSYSEDDERVIFTCRMKDLKDAGRIQAMVDADIVELTSTGDIDALDADTYMQSFLDAGWVKADLLDYSFLHFD